MFSCLDDGRKRLLLGEVLRNERMVNALILSEARENWPAANDGSLNLPQELLLECADAISGVASMKNAAAKSECSDGFINSLGSLLVYFDEADAVNMRLNKLLSLSSTAADDEEAMQSEFRRINSIGKGLLEEKERIEDELEAIISAESMKAAQNGSKIGSELESVSREIVHLRAKLSITTLENKKLMGEPVTPTKGSRFSAQIKI